MPQLPDMDGRLYYAVKCALGRLPAETYDLKKVKILDKFSGAVDPYYENVAGNVVSGEFSAIGIMENLHTLNFPSGFNIPTLQVNDFSFLTQCKKLKRLDVADTNFSDCSLLLQLPALTNVYLPDKSRLTNLDALDALPSKTNVVFRQPTEPVDNTIPQDEEAPEGSEQVKAIIEEIKARTAIDCYNLTILPKKQPGLFDSKFGGLPYWDLSKPYPVGEDGKRLILLAQINFDKSTVEAPLPKSGMLQFFIGGEDCTFGLGENYDDFDKQINFRVVYHEKIDCSVVPEQVQALDVTTHADLKFFPVHHEVAVQIDKATAYMGPDDDRFDEIFRQAVKAVTGKDIGEQDSFKYLNEEDNDYLWHRLSNDGHHLLGYPYFTQEDPRHEDSHYDTLLFQMDSDMSDEMDYTMWGDMGVGSFFINLEDLKRRDFSRVLYTWDCL